MSKVSFFLVSQEHTEHEPFYCQFFFYFCFCFSSNKKEILDEGWKQQTHKKIKLSERFRGFSCVCRNSTEATIKWFMSNIYTHCTPKGINWMGTFNFKISSLYFFSVLHYKRKILSLFLWYTFKLLTHTCGSFFRSYITCS